MLMIVGTARLGISREIGVSVIFYVALFLGHGTAHIFSSVSSISYTELLRTTCSHVFAPLRPGPKVKNPPAGRLASDF